MAAASPGVTRDQLIWTADAYIRPETYQAALARIINAHHELPIAAIWGDGATSSSDGQFFRSAKRGAAAGDINARYGRDPGLSFYTHLSDQHGPYSTKVMSATSHEAPYVLDGLLHHGTLLKDRHALHRYRRRLGSCLHPLRPARLPLLPAVARPARTQARLHRAGFHLSGFAAAPRSAHQDRPHPRTLERDNPPRRLAQGRHGGAVRHAAKTRGLPPPEPTRPGAAGGVGPDRAHAVHARLARKLGFAPAAAMPASTRASSVIPWHRSSAPSSRARIADRGTEAQQFRASGLNLVIAAIAFWNSTYIADAIAHLRTTERPPPDAWLAHTSPLSWEHISLSGDFLWERAAATADCSI